MVASELFLCKLVESELRTIYYRLLPATWRRKMDESNGFLWHEASLRDIVEYAERLETTEQRYVNHQKAGNPVGNADKRGPVGNYKVGNLSDGGPELGSAKGGVAINSKKIKDCLVHGDGCGHSSHQCKLLQSHAEKLRNQHKAQPHKARPHSFKKTNNYKNKTGEDRKYSRAEVQALMKKLEGKRTLENHNMEVDEVPSHETMVDEALEELFNDKE